MPPRARRSTSGPAAAPPLPGAWTMKIAHVTSKRGFTLIELMIVVAIVGILAVLAVYGVRKYLSNAKTAEARNSLGQIAKDQASEYEKENRGTAVMQMQSTSGIARALCGTEPGNPVPATGSIAGARYQSSPADWIKGELPNVPPVGFACLHFTMDAPQYYAYSYTSSGTLGNTGDSFTAVANGDLNGDGLLSTFSLTGAINASYMVNIAPNILEVYSDE
jgi:type IV pilus assembly protein PilA